MHEYIYIHGHFVPCLYQRHIHTREYYTTDNLKSMVTSLVKYDVEADMHTYTHAYIHTRNYYTTENLKSMVTLFTTCMHTYVRIHICMNIYT